MIQANRRLWCGCRYCGCMCPTHAPDGKFSSCASCGFAAHDTTEHPVEVPGPAILRVVAVTLGSFDALLTDIQLIMAGPQE